jgi:hypothetical protein
MSDLARGPSREMNLTKTWLVIEALLGTMHRHPDAPEWVG